ncbi:MAG: PP2C family protein-serine/threonine phosphatase [Acidimicrobiia bacterium]
MGPRPLAPRPPPTGVLTLASTEFGHVYDDNDLALANELAYRIALALDNARAYEQKAAAARALQRSLVPDLAEIPGLEVAARYLPADGEIGGDFYDVFPCGGAGRWIVAMGDVSGKGVAAAALSAMVRHVLHALGRTATDPAVLLRSLHTTVAAELPGERFCTVACATLTIDAGGARLCIASAGHPLPLILRRTGELETVGRPGTLLGTLDSIDVADESTDLRPGDTVVLYTDGALRHRPGDDPPGDIALRETLAAAVGLPAQEIAERLENAVRRPDTNADDTAILVLKIPD